MSTSPGVSLSHKHMAVRVAVLYLVCALLWIFASDRLLILLLDDPEQIARIGIAMMFVFVAVTALLLYLVLRFWGDIHAENHTSLPAPQLRKLASLFLGMLLIVPLVAFSIVRLHTPHVRQTAFSDLRTIAALKAGQIEAWLAERQGGAEMLAKSEELARQAEQLALSGNAATRERVAEKFKSYIAAYPKVYGIDSAMLLNASGQAAATAGEHIDIHPGVLQLLSAALESGRVRRGDLYRDVAGRIFLDYVAPLPKGGDNQGAMAMAVLLRISVADFLFPLIHTWPTPSLTAETLLVRREGDFVLFLSELRHRRGAVLTLRSPLDNPDLPAAAAINSGMPLTMEGIDYRGVTVFASTLPIAGAPWHLVAKIDRDEVMAPLNLLVLWVSLLTLAAVVVITAVMLLLWRQTLRAQRLELDFQTAAILRESEVRYRSLFENMLEGFAYCRIIFEQGRPQDAVFIKVNHSFELLTGLKDVSGKKISEVIPGIRESDPELFGTYGRVALSGNPERFEIYVKALGIWLLSFAYCPEKEYIIAVFDNITERKKAEAEIIQINVTLEKKVEERTAQIKAVNSELETFSYSVSHDLKAPLRGIDGYSQLLLEEHAANLNAEGKIFVANIRKGAQQMSQLIEDLLAYSRLERRALQTARVAPGDVVEAVLAEFNEEIQARHVAVSANLPDLEVSADANGLAMILRNLLDNALKFTRDAPLPTVEFGGREKTDSCILWVRDNGIGFDMRHQERIFEIFQRLHRVENYSGTGIGLAIVRKAAQRMGGRVWAESAPDSGSIFYVELPK